MVKKVVSVAGLLLLCALVAVSSAASVRDAQEVVQSTATQLLEKLEQEREVIDREPRRIYELVNDIVIPHFDFESMAKLVLGKYWRRGSAEQQQRFTEEFRTLLVRTYATSLREYSGQEISYLPMRGQAGNPNATVRSEVQRPGGRPIEIAYRLHQVDGEWKVFDLAIDNVSLVTNYRSSFAREIQKGGFDNLIQALAERNQRVADDRSQG